LTNKIDESMRKAMPNERLEKQIGFILEIDKLKQVLRKTVLSDRSRPENSAEHSWHIALSVLILSEYAPQGAIDLFQVMKLLLVHDLIEIDAGDTYCYDEKGLEDQEVRERQAADRIFNLLPQDQAQNLRSLWEEFEAKTTPESKYANALDRLQPFLLNYFTNGQTWIENRVKQAQGVKRMQPVQKGAPFLWEYVNELIKLAVQKGYLEK